jgi:hypothetical protein
MRHAFYWRLLLWILPGTLASFAPKRRNECPAAETAFRCQQQILSEYVGKLISGMALSHYPYDILQGDVQVTYVRSQA